MYLPTIRRPSTSPILKSSVMVSLLQTFVAFITVPVWGAMEVGAMEVGVIEVGEMEVGVMEVEVAEVCWNERLQQGRQPRLILTLLLLSSPFLCESSSSPQRTHIPDSIFLLHALSSMNPPIPAATPPLSLSSMRSPIPASPTTSSSSMCSHQQILPFLLPFLFLLPRRAFLFLLSLSSSSSTCSLPDSIFLINVFSPTSSPTSTEALLFLLNTLASPMLSTFLVNAFSMASSPIPA